MFRPKFLGKRDAKTSPMEFFMKILIGLLMVVVVIFTVFFAGISMWEIATMDRYQHNCQAVKNE